MSDTKKEIKGFFLYKSQCEAILRLPDAQIAGVIRACFAYIEEKDADLSDPMVGCAFELIRPSLDMAQKRAQAGHNGGTAKANKLKQTLANSSKELADSSNDVANSSKLKQTVANKKQEINNKNIITPLMSPQGDNPAPVRVRFTPPTLGEIEAYCEERMNSVNAEKFFNHYEAVGWMVGKAKMKDWKAAVRKWEADAKPAVHHYTDAELLGVN